MVENRITRRADERGVSGVEYAMIVMLISVVLIAVTGPVGGWLTGTFCTVSDATNGRRGCSAAVSATSTTSASGSASPLATPTAPGVVPISSATATAATPTPTPSSTAVAVPTADPNASAGWMALYTSVIDQDQLLNCLSVRSNAGWQPNSWMNVVYPQVAVLEVTWTPALGVHSIDPGSSGAWVVAESGPGHARLVRNGTFNANGWQPEPEILIDKPGNVQVVVATISVSAARATTVTATSSTTSIPYS